jgi:hypothetical protein
MVSKKNKGCRSGRALQGSVDGFRDVGFNPSGLLQAHDTSETGLNSDF